VLLLLVAATACGAPSPGAQPGEGGGAQDGTGGAADRSEGDTAPGEPVVLRAATAFDEGGAFNDGFWIFRDLLEERSDGRVRIEYVGGPEAIPPFELFAALQDGIVDMANLPGAYYTPHIPVVDGVKLSPLLPWEEREQGVYDFWREVHAEQGVVYLGKSSAGVPFNLYVNRALTTPDLSGLSIRPTPVYTAFVEALGGVAVTTAAGEVYTALERGTVDGYGWPGIGITDLGWQEVTNYRIDHGFYQVDVLVVVNQEAWNRLPADVRSLIEEVMAEAERRQIEHYRREAEQELQLIAEAGVEMITFPEEVAAGYVERAYEAGWEALLQVAPQAGQRLRDLYGN